MQLKNFLCRNGSILVLFISILFLPILGQARVPRTVFRDFNANGVKDNSASNNGIEDVIINAYNSTEALLATQKSSSLSARLGQYSFISSGMNAIPSGTAKDNPTIDAGVHGPATITTTVNISGCYDSNGNTAGGTSQATVQVIVDWENPLNENITVSVPNGGSAQTFDPNTGVKPRVLNFTVPTASATTGNVTANYVTTTTTMATPKAISIAASNCLLTPCVAGSTGGQVFRDYNNNGIKDTYETEGVSGVTVTAYYDNSGTTGTATTATDYKGQYSFSTAQVPSGAKVRLEFMNLPIGVQPTAKGTNNGTTVQFITAPVCGTDMGVNYPTDYCQSNPRLAIPSYANGDYVSGNGAYIPTGRDRRVVSSFNFNDAGTALPTATPTTMAFSQQTGSVWGVAYQRETKKLFVSAVLRRLTMMGPLGTGGIYKIDNADGGTFPTSSNLNFLDVQTIGINTGVNPHTVTGSDLAACDADAIAGVAKIGIGDIDLSEDGKYLFLTNLYDRKLYRVFINNPAVVPTASDVTAYNTAPWITSNPCSNGVARPWAIKVRDTKVYVGVVCTAETGGTRSDLSAKVYELDAVTGVWTANPIADIPLDYHKGYAYGSAGDYWNPWNDQLPAFIAGGTNSGYIAVPTPIVSDIEFDIDGSLILGLMDRTGNQTGRSALQPTAYNNGAACLSDPAQGYGPYVSGMAGGDIIRFASANSIGQVVESNGATLTRSATLGANNGEGLGGGEFYYGDNYATHHENFVGGLATRPGSNILVGSIYDPFAYTSTGVTYFSNRTGKDSLRYEVDDTNAAMGKANGVGDVELLCNTSPVEIGNYVWADTDSDGVQDPTETGLSGVQVRLYSRTGVLVGLTTTNSSGEYYFNTSNVDTTGVNSTTGAALTSFTGMSYNTRYYAVIGQGGSNTFSTATNKLTLGSILYALTAANTGEGTNADANDSDGTLASSVNAAFNGFPYINIVTGSAGQTNHTYDFGFSLIGSVGNYVWNDINANGTNDEAVSAGINGVVVELWSTGADNAIGGIGLNADAVVGTTVTANNGGNPGYYNFVVSTSGSYFVKFPLNNGNKVLTTQTPTAATDGNSDADANGRSPIFVIDINGTGTAKDNPTIDAGYKTTTGCTNLFLDIFTGKAYTTQYYLVGDGAYSYPSAYVTTGSLGGELDVIDEGTGLDAAGTSVFINNKFSLSNDADISTSIGTLVWDGLDNNASAINYTGLGGIDITNGGLRNRLNFDFQADFNPSISDPITITLDVYTNSGAASRASITFDGPQSVFANYTIPFSSFTSLLGGGADLTNVGAISMKIDMTSRASFDMRINNIAFLCTPVEGSVGNYVWKDANSNGLNDEPASEGINGITVELWNATTNTLVTTTTTANNAGNPGYYNFAISTNGNYYVKFPTTNNVRILTTQTSTAATDGNSDANTSTGASPVFAIDVNGTGMAKDNPTIDAGFKCNLTAVIAKSNDLSCPTPTATLTASPATGVSYIWDDGSTSMTRVVSAAGTYSVTVIDNSNGCNSSANVTVTSTVSVPPCVPITNQKTK